MTITLVDTKSGYNLSTINDNFDKIETAINDALLWRDADTLDESQMHNDLDLGSFKGINLADGTEDSDAVNLGQLLTEIDNLRQELA